MAHDVIGVAMSYVASLRSWKLVIGRTVSSKGPADVFSDFCWLIAELGLIEEFLDSLENFCRKLGLSAIESFICLIYNHSLK
jgi:hypothetical protein